MQKNDSLRDNEGIENQQQNFGGFNFNPNQNKAFNKVKTHRLNRQGSNNDLTFAGQTKEEMVNELDFILNPDNKYAQMKQPFLKKVLEEKNTDRLKVQLDQIVLDNQEKKPIIIELKEDSLADIKKEYPSSSE